jgi:hypothetical protein
MVSHTPKPSSRDIEVNRNPKKESNVIPVSYTSKMLKRESRYSDKIQHIIDQILAAKNIKPILFNLTNEIN